MDTQAVLQRSTPTHNGTHAEGGTRAQYTYGGANRYGATDNLCYKINPNSGIANELHLHYFHFAGSLSILPGYSSVL